MWHHFHETYNYFRSIFVPIIHAPKVTDAMIEATILRVNVPVDVMDQIVIKFLER